MGEHASRERLQPSLLDRLTDDERDRARESADRQMLSNTQLRQAVLRDLTWLLNTSRPGAALDLAGFPRAAASTLNYGIPGLAGGATAAAALAALQAAIVEAVRRYEPRILPETLKVRVQPGRQGAASGMIVLAIEGELWAQPAPQALFLHAAIDGDSHTVTVDEQPRR